MVAQSMRGLSLFELLTTLALLAALVSLATPSFSRMLAEQRLRYIGTELRLSLSSARSEAVKRNEGVALLSREADWSNGWCLEPSTEVTCTDRPIQQFKLPAERVVLSAESTTAGTAVQFNAWGRVTDCPKFTLATTAAGATCTLCFLVTPDGRVQSHTGDCPSACDTSGAAMTWSGVCS